MALRIELEGYKPGIARFLAQKWNGSADIDILIQRNQDNYYLSGLNQWGPEKNWHSLNNMSVDNEQLIGYVDEWLVDSLLSQENSVRFLIQIRDEQNESYTDSGVVNIGETVFPSSALKTQTEQPQVIEQNTIEINEVNSNSVQPDSIESLDPQSELPTVEEENQAMTEPEVEIEVTPEPETKQEVISTPEPTKSKSKLRIFILIFIIILILSGLGALAWYFLFSQDKSSSDTSIQGNSQCNVANVTSDDLTFIQQCLQSKPNTDVLIEIINQAKQANKCNIAQRLYANQSLLNAKIALLYAKEYDEKFYHNNSCFKADKETAIYWYETTLNNDPNNALAKERLAELQK